LSKTYKKEKGGKRRESGMRLEDIREEARKVLREIVLEARKWYDRCVGDPVVLLCNHIVGISSIRLH
jgi:hypothetical protein